MPNAIDQNGLTIQSITEIISEIENGSISFPGYLTIFPGANLNPNSPDANLINIFAQAKLDVLEFLQQIYDSFDPDQAIGPTLDARCSINGIVRKAGTYTTQNVDVTTSQGVSLQGLDLYPSNPFTVQDGQGNQYQLMTTTAIGSAGTQSLPCQAASIGAIQSGVGAISQVVTAVAGVTSVTNSVGYSLLGQNEETDSQLRIRRANSVANGSTGYANGLLGVLLEVQGVTGAVVLENDTTVIDSRGIPGHSIWVIVAGSSATFNTDVANAIYSKKNGGAGQTNAGQGAIGTAVLTPTTVASAIVGNPGTGYVSAPTVAFSGGGGTGATGTATISSGQVTGITITSAGTGYTSAPTIALTGGSGTGAAATAVLTPTSVASISLTAAGNGYANPPVVALTGEAGTGATATAVVAGGAVTGFTVTAGGTGYTSAPTVVLNSNTVVVSINQRAGPPKVIYFDKPIPESIYFRAQVAVITGTLPDLTWLAKQIAATSYAIGQAADSSSLVALIKELAPNVYVTAEGVSDNNATWVPILSTPGVNYQFNLPLANVTLTT